MANQKAAAERILAAEFVEALKEKILAAKDEAELAQLLAISTKKGVGGVKPGVAYTNKDGSTGVARVMQYGNKLLAGYDSADQYIPTVSRVSYTDPKGKLQVAEFVLSGGSFDEAVDYAVRNKGLPIELLENESTKERLRNDYERNARIFSSLDSHLQNVAKFGTEAGVLAGVQYGQNNLYDRLSNPLNIVKDERTRMAGAALAALGLIPGVGAGIGGAMLMSDDSGANDLAIQQALMAGGY